MLTRPFFLAGLVGAWPSRVGMRPTGLQHPHRPDGLVDLARERLSHGPRGVAPPPAAAPSP